MNAAQEFCGKNISSTPLMMDLTQLQSETCVAVSALTFPSTHPIYCTERVVRMVASVVSFLLEVQVVLCALWDCAKTMRFTWVSSRGAALHAVFYQAYLNV